MPWLNVLQPIFDATSSGLNGFSHDLLLEELDEYVPLGGGGRENLKIWCVMGEIWLEIFIFSLVFGNFFSTATEWDKFRKNVQFRGTKSEIKAWNS